MNGSPLFTGKAGSGESEESEIRRWVIESDLLDAIVALPTDMFYNTGIATYIWVLDRKKPEERRGKVQLIDGSKMFVKMRKSLGSKRKELSVDDVAALVKLYGAFEDGVDKRSKVFTNEAFGYHTITVERPLTAELPGDARAHRRGPRSHTRRQAERGHASATTPGAPDDGCRDGVAGPRCVRYRAGQGIGWGRRAGRPAGAQGAVGVAR